MSIKEDKQRIGSVISMKRHEKKLTQLEVSEKAGLSRSYISDVEKGRYTPSVKALTSLAICLDLDLNFLIIKDGNTSGFMG